MRTYAYVNITNNFNYLSTCIYICLKSENYTRTKLMIYETKSWVSRVWYKPIVILSFYSFFQETLHRITRRRN